MIVWIDAGKELPDDETTVLIALSDGEIWTGFHNDGKWHFVSSDEVDQGDGASVTHWADFPNPPTSNNPNEEKGIPR
jgi:hypothetical protein